MILFLDHKIFRQWLWNGVAYFDDKFTGCLANYTPLCTDSALSSPVSSGRTQCWRGTCSVQRRFRPLHSNRRRLLAIRGSMVRDSDADKSRDRCVVMGRFADRQIPAARRELRKELGGISATPTMR